MSTVIEMRMEAGVVELMDYVASKRGVTRDDLITQIMRDHLNRMIDDKKPQAQSIRRREGAFWVCLNDVAEKFGSDFVEVIGSLEVGDDYIEEDDLYYGGSYALSTMLANLRMNGRDAKAEDLEAWITRNEG